MDLWRGPFARPLAGFGLGGLLVLAFAPFEQGLLALPVLALLLHLLRGAPGARAAALSGYAFGLALLGFGVFWLRISINQFGGVSLPLGLFFTLLFVLVVAGYFAFFGWLAWFLGRTRGPLGFMLLAAPAAWLATELLRAYLFTGFPWLSVGYSQIDTPLAGYAPIFGVFGSGYVLLLSAGLVNLWRRLWAVPLLIGLWAGGYGLALVEWGRPVGAVLPVALVQGNIPQAEKWERRMFEPTLALYQGLTARAPQARLVVWPETAIPAFDDRIEDSVLQPLERRMIEQERDLLSGIVSRQPDGRYYNSMLGMGVSGRQVYHKHHLVPFGEFLPLAALLDPVLGFLDIPMSDFASGNGDARPLRLAGYPVGVNICYEDAFGNEVAATLPEAEFLINASNDAWFGDSLAPHQHLQIARMRALEAGRYFLRATNTGVSAIIRPDGSILRQAPQFQQAVLSASIQPLQGATPYALWRDLPMLSLAGLLLLGLGIGRRRRISADSDRL